MTTVVNQKNGKYHKKSMRTRSENKLTTLSAGKRSDQVATSFAFESDWLKG